MPELFVSYSRRNKAFVQSLVKALNENGYSDKDIWIDWEDIPATSKWENEIGKGIEGSSSVIFVLSPHWAKSKECEKEFKLAKEYHKRFFPIVVQNVSPDLLPHELASLNWIFFRKTDDFNNSLTRLLDSFQTDLDWVHQHTQLLQSANNWKKKGRDTSSLLRGTELAEAEKWLSDAGKDKQRKPTALQTEYIVKSRQEETRRQRRSLWGVSIALFVSIVLAVSAVIAGLEAARQGQKALASQLAAQSTNLLYTQPDKSLLLSLEANHIGDQLGETDAAWLGSLLTSLNASPHLGEYLRDHEGAVRSLVFSSDGKWLASAGQDGRVLLWDATDVNKSPVKLIDLEQRLLSVRFSKDNRYVYAAGADKLVYVWDIQNGFELLGPWEANTDKEIRALDVVTLNNRELLAVASGGQVVFLDTATGKVMPSRTLHLEAVEFGNIRSMAVTKDGSLLAVGSDDGKITVWELTGKKKVSAWCAFPDPQATDETTCSTIGSIRGMTFSPDGKFLVSGGSEDVYARLWDVSTGTLKSITPESSEGGHTNTVSAMAFNGPNEVVTASWDNTVRVWRLDGEERKFVLTDVLYGHANSIWTVTIHPNGKIFASGSSDESVIIWKIDQLNQIGTQVAKLGENVWALAITPNRKQVAAGDGTGRIQLWSFDGTSLTELGSLKQNGDVFSLAYSPDGRILVSAGNEGTIHFWDTETGMETDPIEKAHDDQIWSVAFSPDGRYLASASFDQKVKIWDVTTHKQIGASLDHKETIYALAFNKDGSKLLVAGYGSNIHVWDMRVIDQPVKLESLEGHEAAVNSISFNPQLPNVFASTSDDKTLRIWNIENEKVQVTSPVIGFGESMEAVAFHPNGKELASATNNKTVLLWDWTMDCNWDKNECQPDRLGSPLVGHTTQVQNVLFLSDEKLLSSSEDGQLILWDLDKLHWYEKACSIVNEKWDAQIQSQNTDGKLRPQLLNVQAWWVEHVQKKVIATPSCLVDDPS